MRLLIVVGLVLPFVALAQDNSECWKEGWQQGWCDAHRQLSWNALVEQDSAPQGDQCLAALPPLPPLAPLGRSDCQSRFADGYVSGMALGFYPQRSRRR